MKSIARIGLIVSGIMTLWLAKPRGPGERATGNQGV